MEIVNELANPKRRKRQREADFRNQDVLRKIGPVHSQQHHVPGGVCVVADACDELRV